MSKEDRIALKKETAAAAKAERAASKKKKTEKEAKAKAKAEKEEREKREAEEAEEAAEKAHEEDQDAKRKKRWAMEDKHMTPELKKKRQWVAQRTCIASLLRQISRTLRNDHLSLFLLFISQLLQKGNTGVGGPRRGEREEEGDQEARRGAAPRVSGNGETGGRILQARGGQGRVQAAAQRQR